MTSPMTLSARGGCARTWTFRSEEHTSELQSQSNIVCRLLLEEKHGLRPVAQVGVFRHGPVCPDPLFAEDPDSKRQSPRPIELLSTALCGERGGANVGEEPPLQ